MDCEHDRGRGTETAEVSVPPVPDMYACAHTRGVWASMTPTARTAHRRMVRAAKQAAKRKEASLEDQASVGAVAIAKRNAATATRRAMVALSLKTSLLAQLTAADSAIIQTAHEATLAGRALDSERCSASRILAARQHWSDQDISSPFSRNSSSLRWHCTSPAEPPTGPSSLAASSPERLGSSPHYACWPTPAESCGASEDDRYGAIDQQLAPSRPADTKEELPSYEPDKGSGTDTSEDSAPSMPGKYCWTHTPAIWAGMTATARAAHSEVARAAKEAAPQRRLQTLNKNPWNIRHLQTRSPLRTGMSLPRCAVQGRRSLSRTASAPNWRRLNHRSSRPRTRPPSPAKHWIQKSAVPRASWQTAGVFPAKTPRTPPAGVHSHRALIRPSGRTSVHAQQASGLQRLTPLRLSSLGTRRRSQGQHGFPQI